MPDKISVSQDNVYIVTNCPIYCGTGCQKHFLSTTPIENVKYRLDHFQRLGKTLGSLEIWLNKSLGTHSKNLDISYRYNKYKSNKISPVIYVFAIPNRKPSEFQNCNVYWISYYAEA